MRVDLDRERLYAALPDNSAQSPNIKHATYGGFQRFLQPFLATAGFPRESYEIVCAFREPIDWLAS